MGKSNTQQLALIRKHLDEGGSRFRKFCGMKSGPYCNAFVDYGFNEADNASLFCDGKRITYCPNSIKWCYKHLASIPIYLALESDVIYFDWEPNETPNHIGFVDHRISDQVIATIEGNTSKVVITKDGKEKVVATGVVAQRNRPLYGKKNGKKVRYIQAVFRPHFKPTAFSPNKKLVVDGYFGYSSIAVMQKWLGVKVDAILKKSDIVALQKRLKVNADGDWGPKTSKELQKILNVEVDGEFGPKSVKAFQTYLNDKMFKEKPAQKATPKTTTAKPAPAAKPAPVKTAQAKPVKPKLPTLALKKTAEQVIKDTLIWCDWIESDNSFHYGHGHHAHHNGCYFCGTQPKVKKEAGIKEWKKTYCCNPYAHAAFAHGGCDKGMLDMCNKGKSYGFLASEGYAKSKKFKRVNAIKAGDICCSNSHVAIYAGNGMFHQAGHEDDNKIGSKSWNSSINKSKWTGWERAYRYVGSVNIKKQSLRIGEVSDRVKMWQQFLNWHYGKKVVAEDRIFGFATEKWTKQYQKDVGFDTQSGKVGSKTLAKADKER